MHLYLQRRQSRGSYSLVPLRVSGGVLFRLTAKLELSEEESFLVREYGFRDALLIDADHTDVLRRSLRLALFVGALAWLLFAALFDIYAASFLAAVLAAGLCYLFYNHLRQHVYVRDLLNGRSFDCFSIVELVHQEQHLTAICQYFRQVLETARHWQGREQIEIPPLDPETAKHLVLKVG